VIRSGGVWRIDEEPDTLCARHFLTGGAKPMRRCGECHGKKSATASARFEITDCDLKASVHPG